VYLNHLSGRGNEAIEIQLPGVKNPSGVKKAIGTTGSLEYRLVDDKYSAMLHHGWLRILKTGNCLKIMMN
jgi:preprotein translocase subunit SecD